MSDSITKAEVTTVKMGSLEVQGLLFPDGTFGIAIPQLVDLNLIPPNRSLKQLEALHSISFQSHQKAKTVIHPKSVNVISLIDFEKLLAKLDRSGNKDAQNFRDALVGLSLTQLFSDAFGVKFEAEERQGYLKARLQGKVARRSLTDAIRDYCLRNEPSENYCKFIYSNVSDCLNRGLLGKTSKQLCEELKIDKDRLRDAFNEQTLKNIDYLEQNALKLIDRRNVEPMEAMKEALALYV